MSKQTTMSRPMAPARQKLLEAALALIREKGYASTTVDDLCAKARVAKGSFFHHFKEKEALAVAAADYWSEATGAFFAAAPYHRHKDPLDRVLGYIDFRKSILKGEVAEFTCLVGRWCRKSMNRTRRSARRAMPALAAMPRKSRPISPKR
jgi:TetR/AcrR family transcriptional repressor of nem operon